MRDEVALSLSCVETLINLKPDTDVLKSFRARARSIPADMSVHGFTYILALLAARSSREALEQGLRLDNCEELAEAIIRSKDLSSEKKGYGLYGAMILHILKRLNVVRDVDKFGDLIIKVADDPIVELKAKIVMEWLKRFSEAYLSGL